ncbi:MAG: FUSC family protein, partial [Corynebacterium pollutisoli]|nr:FUSC family protein [Corynebacterium pollutisoli]
MMETPPPRPSAWQLFTAFHSPGRRWPGALRAGLAMGLPGTVAILLGFEAELLLIAAGSFTVIHGEGYAYRARWK